MLAAIDAARTSVCLESYIFSDSTLGRRFLDVLLRARQRGVRARVLVDAFGSLTLADEFWRPLREAGGEARFFNPLALDRFEIRNHRKLLVCDDRVAFVGGFNIAPEYEGDGVTQGWRDVGLQLEGPIAADLALSFEEMFALADFRHKRFARFRRGPLRRLIGSAGREILIGGPGLGRNPIRRALQADLAQAREARIVVAYFLPRGKLRRTLTRVARRGGLLHLILPGRSDVYMSQLAAQGLYRRFLKAGAKICEYQPQILHAKLFVIDDIVYVGSANLDPRSLSINYELMLRFQNAQMAGEARDIFNQVQEHSRPVELKEWLRTRTFWARLKRRWAYFVLARVDPYVASRQWRSLKD